MKKIIIQQLLKYIIDLVILIILSDQLKKKILTLYFHNDPLINGWFSNNSERKNLLKNCYKIIFNS